MSEKIKNIIFLSLRIGLGGMFLFSGYMKLLDVESFIDTIYKIKFISPSLSTIISISIIGIELLIGVMLILGLYIDSLLYTVIVVLSIFTLFLFFVLIFHLEIISCNCFGAMSSNKITTYDIMRNLIILTLSIIMKYKNQNLFLLSLDKHYKLKSEDKY